MEHDTTDATTRGIAYRPPRVPEEEMLRRAEAFYRLMNGRRSVRLFSDEVPPRAAIEHAIRAAGTAPSGANKQPWTFVVVDDPELKAQIRHAAEREERLFYGRRATEAWLRDLAPLSTGWCKPFLEVAPYLIVCLQQTYGLDVDGRRSKHYYTSESVGIAVGVLVAALQHMGLVGLTHTPSPMRFLTRLLQRPPNERPFVLMPVGYPHPDATVPAIERKPLDEILVYNRGAGPTLDGGIDAPRRPGELELI